MATSSPASRTVLDPAHRASETVALLPVETQLLTLYQSTRVATEQLGSQSGELRDLDNFIEAISLLRLGCQIGDIEYVG